MSCGHKEYLGYKKPYIPFGHGARSPSNFSSSHQNAHFLRWRGQSDRTLSGLSSGSESNSKKRVHYSPNGNLNNLYDCNEGRLSIGISKTIPHMYAIGSNSSSNSKGTTGYERASNSNDYHNNRKFLRRRLRAVLGGSEVFHGVANSPRLCLLGSSASLRLSIMKSIFNGHLTHFFGRCNINASIL